MGSSDVATVAIAAVVKQDGGGSGVVEQSDANVRYVAAAIKSGEEIIPTAEAAVFLLGALEWVNVQRQGCVAAEGGDPVAPIEIDAIKYLPRPFLGAEREPSEPVGPDELAEAPTLKALAVASGDKIRTRNPESAARLKRTHRKLRVRCF